VSVQGYQRTPEGLLCINDMPARVAPGDRRRWVASRKAVIVAGVRIGLLSETQACERYALTREELVEWMARYDSGGRPGLRVTRRQRFARSSRA
jgi:hypothetical protein